MCTLDVLINVAELDRAHFLMANLAFKRRYSNREFMIQANFDLPEPKSRLSMIGDSVSSIFQWIGIKSDKKVSSKPQSMIKKWENRPVYIECGATIELKDYEIIEKLFKHFGHLIFNLKIVYDEDHEPQAECIGKLISNYSSYTLVNVEFRHCTEDTLEYLTKPLVNVRTVQFSDSFENTGEKILAFNQLFPGVERLYLNCWFSHITYIDTYMSCLKHLHLKADAKYWWNDLRFIANVKRFLTKNAHIKSIELQAIPEVQMIVLQPIRDLLTELQNLTLWKCEEIETPLRFENVTTFSVKMSDTSPENFHFPKLRNLHMKIRNRDEVDMWIFFLLRHTEITEFHFTYYNHNEQDFEELLHVMPNLTKFYMSLSGELITVDCIKHLLGSHANLSAFHLTFNDVQDKTSYRQTLMDMNTVWSVYEINNGVSFERSNE